MASDFVPSWLEWAREIEALGQSGLAYTGSPYDAERYERLLQLAAEIVHSHTTLPRTSVLDGFRAQSGYATPKVDIRGAVVREGRILLVQERVDSRWCMPGGWADVGDRPSEMVVREVWEESGFDVVPRKVIGVYDANREGIPLEFYHAYKIVFLCDLVGGQPRPSSETQDVGFFSLDQLPPLSSARTHERHLAEVMAHVRDPNRAAAFD